MTLVREFHLRYPDTQPAPTSPPLSPNPEQARTRARLIREEFKEAMAELEALAHATAPDETIRIYRQLLKELADLRYVVEGTAVVFGLPIDDAFAAVHASNMTKSLEVNGWGKVIKGDSYCPPDMALLVADIVTQKEEENDS